MPDTDASWYSSRASTASVPPASRDPHRFQPQPGQPGRLDAPAAIELYIGFMVMPEPVEIGDITVQRMLLRPVEPVLHRPEAPGGGVGENLDIGGVAVMDRNPDPPPA